MKILTITRNGQQSQLQCDDELAKLILSKDTGKKPLNSLDQLTELNLFGSFQKLKNKKLDELVSC